MKASTINFQVGWLSLSAIPACQGHKLCWPLSPSKERCCGRLIEDHRTGRGESPGSRQTAECAADTVPSLGAGGWERCHGGVVTQTLDSFQTHYCKVRFVRFRIQENCAWRHCNRVCERWHLSSLYWYERKQVDVSDLSAKPLSSHSCNILCLNFNRQEIGCSLWIFLSFSWLSTVQLSLKASKIYVYTHGIT